jgi:hypothetical protein
MIFHERWFVNTKADSIVREISRKTTVEISILLKKALILGVLLFPHEWPIKFQCGTFGRATPTGKPPVFHLSNHKQT